MVVETKATVVGDLVCVLEMCVELAEAMVGVAERVDREVLAEDENCVVDAIGIVTVFGEVIPRGCKYPDAIRDVV